MPDRSPIQQYSFGPLLSHEEVEFRLWAPGKRVVDLLLNGRRLTMERVPGGWFRLPVAGVGPNERYAFSADGGEPIADPAAHWQPNGVFDASQLLCLDFQWKSPAWAGFAAPQMVLYELHVGTFSPSGDYAGVSDRLQHLQDLGINAIELMPLATSSGARNWGYDGVLPFAPFPAYGHPRELQRLVDNCHERDIAVVLDLVSNHFGPEGNAMAELAPEFFRSRGTAWGPGPDFNKPEILAFYEQLIGYWISAFQIDGFRMDAFDAIPARMRKAHLQSMISAAEQALPSGRRAGFILEGEADLTPLSKLATARVDVLYLPVSRPFIEQLRLPASARHPGSWTQWLGLLENHDTVGNHAQGLRLYARAGQQMARALLLLRLLHPAPPMLWMGQEWGSEAPFYFFTDFLPALGRRVEGGRDRLLGVGATDRRRVPRCQSLEAFEASKLDWSEREREPGRRNLNFVRKLLRLRRKLVPRMSSDASQFELWENRELMRMEIPSRDGGSRFVFVLNQSQTSRRIPSEWRRIIGSDPEPPCDHILPGHSSLFETG